MWILVAGLDLSWGKIAAIVIGIVLTTVLSNWGTAAYFRGSTEMDLKHVRENYLIIKEQLRDKPSNEVLLQYMNLQHERFKFNETRLNDHLKVSSDNWDAQEKKNEIIEVGRRPSRNLFPFSWIDDLNRQSN